MLIKKKKRQITDYLASTGQCKQNSSFTTSEVKEDVRRQRAEEVTRCDEGVFEGDFYRELEDVKDGSSIVSEHWICSAD